MNDTHPLLRRQIRRHIPPELMDSDALAPLLQAVDAAYRSSDEDRAMLERAMDISSEELNAANMEMQVVLSGLPERVMLVDEDGIVTDVKSEALPSLGLDAGVDLAQTVIGSSHLLRALQSAISGETPEPIQVRVDCQNRDECSLVVHVRPCGDETAVVIVNDTTAQLRAERALAELEASERTARLKSEFLATMSHEIRSPMNAVVGMTSLLTRSNLDVQQREMVDTIRTSGEALVALINDILDFSKIEAGSLQVESIPLDPSRLADDTIELLTGKARARGLELETLSDLDPEQSIVGDAVRLRQVLVNLVDNAIKFTPTGKVVLRVQLVEGGERVRFAVEDTGIGIKEEALGRILQPFEQADGSTTRNFGGTGLGLSICTRLVELMGGRLEIESEPGKGSTFHFTLPTGVENAAPAVRDGSRGLALFTARWPLRAEAIATKLERLGYDAERVEPEALVSRASESRTPAAILIDMTRLDAHSIRALGELSQADGLEGTALVGLTDAGADLPSTAAGDRRVQTARVPLRLRALADVLGHGDGDANRSTPSASDGPSLPAMTVLVVEDNPVNQLVARRMLERLGVQFEFAGNGAEAIESTDRRRFDLVLMDCQMPVLDGYGATRAIRARERATGDHVPIVALTANAMQGDREKCFEAGMDDHLAKPFDLEQLRAMLIRHGQRSEAA